MRSAPLGAVLLLFACHAATPSSSTKDLSVPTLSSDMTGSAQSQPDLTGVPPGADLAQAVAPMDMAPSIGASVLQLHNHATRDGVFVEPTFTTAAVAKLHIDAAFDGTYSQSGASGASYAQPLFVDNGGAGDLVFVVTEANYVLAFNATTGKVKWHTDPAVLGTAAPGSAFSCGNIDPSGITGTPVIDLATRAIFFQTDVLQGGTTKHLIHSLSIDDGSKRAGWPIDVSAVVPGFDSKQQGQRGGLIVLGDKVYVPFGGRAGDCIPYRGYVIGLPLTNPTAAAAVVFKTKAQDGAGHGAGVGIWGGLASDGTSLYFTTGNTRGTFPTDWTQSYSEGIFRLRPSLAFDINDKTSYFSPTDWNPLDQSDTDISGSGIMLVDVPGAAKPHLAVVLGKDTKMYLVDRANLGGSTMTAPSSSSVASSEIINVPSVYTTTKGTYVTFKAQCPAGGKPTVNAVKLTNGPGAGTAWCGNVQGGGSPVVSTTGGGQNTVVWWVSTEGEGVTPDFKLRGFDGDTGTVLVTTAAMTSMRRFVSPIVAKGHVYVATDARLYSFITP